MDTALKKMEVTVVQSDSETEGPHHVLEQLPVAPGQPLAKKPAWDGAKGGPAQAPADKPLSPISKAAQKKARAPSDPQQLDLRDGRQPAPAPNTAPKVQLVVPAEFQDVIATETYANDPVLTAALGRDHLRRQRTSSSGVVRPSSRFRSRT